MVFEMYCQNCGKQVNETAKFCSNCGFKLIPDLVSENNIEEKTVVTSSSNTETSWYYLSGGEQKGPCTTEELKALAEQNVVSRKTKIWNDRLKDWTDLEATELGTIIKKSIPETPAEMLSDKWVWALATVPIISGKILSGFVPSEYAIATTLIIIVLIAFFWQRTQDT